MQTPASAISFSAAALAPWFSVGATFLAVAVALFKDEITRLWRRPQLMARIALRVPDCVKTPFFVTTGAVKEGTIYQKNYTFDCYYFRLWIENTGKQRAERTQVYAAKLLRKHADGVFREVEGFLPMNLRWAHSTDPSKPIIFDDINPRMGKHCDLGRVLDPKAGTDLGLDRLDRVPRGRTILHLDVEVEPATGSHLLPPDVYQLQLRIAAANATPVDKHLEITLTGDWFADQAKMFADAIGIRELN
jgi:hypothetical protein